VVDEQRYLRELVYARWAILGEREEVIALLARVMAARDGKTRTFDENGGHEPVPPEPVFEVLSRVSEWTPAQDALLCQLVLGPTAFAGHWSGGPTCHLGLSVDRRHVELGRTQPTEAIIRLLAEQSPWLKLTPTLLVQAGLLTPEDKVEPLGGWESSGRTPRVGSP
jgi:hypothetical protein